MGRGDEMVDREKVVANVTGIVSDMQEEVDEWKNYSDSELSHGLTCDCDWWYKTLQTLKDALVLLKEQEPRVMTLEEYKTSAEKPKEERDPVWEEWPGLKCTWEMPNQAYGGYGTSWRAWTSRPSDEVRRETPWE